MNKILMNKSGNLVLELRQETRSAWLTIKKTGKLVDERDILNLIEEAGIKYGFEDALRYIRESSLEKEFDVPFPIAMSCEKESSSTLRYNFNPDYQPDFSSGISFQELEKLCYMQSGDVVALYSNNIFEQGGSIYDIFGELINPTIVDLDLAINLAGDGVNYIQQSHEYIAMKSGYPFLDEEGRICILDVLVLNAEDVPSETSLHIRVELVVKGNLAFAKIECDGNLTIKGDLHSCQLQCQKDLYVEGNIYGYTGLGIKVLGDVTCKGLSDTKLLCNGQIKFSSLIENSTIACSGEVLGISSQSVIRGGLIQAGGSISIAEAGSLDGAKTEIEVAISPFYRALLMQLTKQLVHLKEDSEGNAVAILELQKKIEECELNLDEQLNMFLKKPADDKKSIKVTGEVLPPVLFRVLKHAYYVKTKEQNLEYVEKE